MKVSQSVGKRRLVGPSCLAAFTHGACCFIYSLNLKSSFVKMRRGFVFSVISSNNIVICVMTGGGGGKT